MKLRLAALVAAAALTLSSAAARADQFVNILTGGTSGVYYPLGVAMSKIYSDTIPGAKVQVQSTKASVENMNLLQAGRGEIAFSLGDTVSAAWSGDEEAGFKKKLDKLRGIAALYPNYIQIVAAKDSGIRTLADLKGKRVSVGAPKSGTELNARKVLSAAGLTYQDLGKVEYLPFGESVELIKNRQLDATLQSAGLGVASIRDLATSLPITVVAVPAEMVAKIGDPAYVAASIPPGTYEGQADAVPAVAIINYLVSTSAVSDDLAYQMTRQLFEHRTDLVSAHAAAKDIKLEEATKGMPIPLHPGAEKFYREKGVVK
jgi:TRAP transporter TAXI family solute receptor